MTRQAASTALLAACESGRLERTRVVPALLELAEVEADEAERAVVLRLGETMLGGGFGERRHADILEHCVRILAQSPDRAALRFYRAASAVYLPTPRGDMACTLRAAALVALRAVAADEAPFVAARLLAGEQSASGEPACTALAVLGAAGDDVALTLACRTVLAGELPLVVEALERMSSAVPPDVFWEIATPLMGDRFGDAVLAISDLIVAGRRGDLLPGLATSLATLSDPDLVRAVLLGLLGAHLDGVEAVFAAVVEDAPVRALPGAEEALMLARIPRRDQLLHRLSERARRQER